MLNVQEIFGSLVFNDSVMQTRLPRDTYKALKKTIEKGSHLELETANIVANAMKNWAVEKGATHFTHWFHPMTGVTAEKHDSFISPAGDDKVIMEFSGKELVRGEPDASSFPSGGLRATFEARGYTAWDPTSYAFIKDGTLCIPTAFCSYGGQSLDKKTPLLRSMQAIDRQAMRILNLFGNTKVKRVVSTVGAEQEYFLIDKEIFLKRPDLVYCGRTLYGAKPPKGQEMDDHYFGAIKPRVSAFMKELEEELWKLGILAKTKHNESAPAQHEMAPIFITTNIASDHNQLTMELMKSIANKHGLACLLHEKPFAGINGSGKHNNWSLSTDTGINLLEPGETPFDNAQFLLFIVAVIKAVDDFQDLLRVAVSSAGNDCRLGANEAPPAVVSMFLGDELTEILTAIETGSVYPGKERIQLEIGVTALPHFPKDSTDRNRTSPFAFTGNKFEFRMLGSAFSIACPNFILNTIIADTLCGFADILEKSENFTADLSTLIKQTFRNHKRIIFNGNNYSEEWITQAESRGLLNLKTTVDALPSYIKQKNIEVFEKHRVLTKAEVYSRYEILLENYCKTIHIEALTMLDIAKKHILPSSFEYQSILANLARQKMQCGSFSVTAEESLLRKLSNLTALFCEKLEILEKTLQDAGTNCDSLEQAKFCCFNVFVKMADLRLTADEIESAVGKKYWSLPTYAEILNSVS